MAASFCLFLASTLILAMASQDEKKHDSPGVVLVKQLAAGTVAGITQVIVGHPFDTIKVKMQMQTATHREYTGIVDCVKKTLAKEGPKGFFKGMLSPLSGIALVNAIIFGSYSQAKGKFEEHHAKDGSSKNLRYGLLPYHEVALCGAFAGFTNSFVSGPVELMKTQMQVQYRNPDTSKHYKGSFDAAQKIIQVAGFRKVFLGLEATMIREIPGTAGYYAAYELSRRLIAGDGDPRELSIPYLLLSGALGGIGYWVCCYPFDLIKSRIQAQSVHAPPTYHSWMHCARTMIATEGGYRALSRGFSAAILRTIPASGATFAAFEVTMRYLNRPQQ